MGGSPFLRTVEKSSKLFRGRQFRDQSGLFDVTKNRGDFPGLDMQRQQSNSFFHFSVDIYVYDQGSLKTEPMSLFLEL